MYKNEDNNVKVHTFIRCKLWQSLRDKNMFHILMFSLNKIVILLDISEIYQIENLGVLVDIRSCKIALRKVLNIVFDS